MKKVLILESGSDSGVSAIRSVEKAGAVAIPADSNPFAASSFHENFQILSDAQTETYVDEIEKLIVREGITHVLPTFFHRSDEIVRLARGLPWVRFLCSPPEVLTKVQDKFYFAELYRYYSVIPLTRFDWSEATPFRKPRFGKGSRGVSHLPYGPPHGEDDWKYVYQEYLPGAQYTVDLLLDPSTGEPLQAVAREVHTMKRGTDTVATIHPGHPLEAIALDLARSIGLRGACNMEFRHDAMGRPKVIDINPRLSASFSMTEEAGLDLVSWLLEGSRFTKRPLTGGTYFRSPWGILRGKRAS